ncbi:MAG: hypothetical protein HYU60_00040 [Magnetospirillum sp.]|nr:hypothetical protein [Magnetospirillum sp.]
MSITYPLSLPFPAIRKIRLSGRAVVAVSESPFTLSQQVQAYPGQRWGAEVVLRPLSIAESKTWRAFLFKLNGRLGTFLMGDPDGMAPRGTPTGTPVVDGAGQNGQQLATRGWTAGAAGVLLAGDMIQLGSGASSRLHQVLNDVSADGAGKATIDIWPRLRESPDDNAPVVTSNAMGVWRMVGNEAGWESDHAVSISFQAMEAL